MSRNEALRWGLLTLLIVTPLVARSTDDERSIELEEIEVRLPRPEPAAGPTASTTIIEAQRFASESKSVAEMVGTAPGVSIQEYGGLGHLATVSIRGASADQVVVLLDGMPLNTAAGGGVDLSSIPREWIERIEVVRGAQGTHYGSGALGGAVNIVTKPALAGSWSGQATGGSFLTFSAGADGATGSDRWTVLGAVAGEGSSGRFPYDHDSTLGRPGDTTERLRENNGSLLIGGLVKGWTLLGAGRGDALLQLSGGHRELPGWPSYLTPSDYQEDARLIGRLRYSNPISEGLVFSTELAGRYDRLDARLRYLDHPVHQRGQEGSVQLALSWVRDWSALTVSVSGGFEALSASGMESHQRARLAATISEECSLDGGKLTLAPAIRVERQGAFQGLSAKLGVMKALGGPLSLRASAGRTFRSPSFSELYLQQGLIQPNPALRPEVGWSGDLALIAEGSLGMATAGAFISLYQDLVVYQAAAFRRVMPQNDEKAVVRGLELELMTTPLRRLLGVQGAVAYTFMQTEILRGVDGVVGNEIPRRPRHRLYARLSMKHGPVEAHTDGQYVGSQWQEEHNLQVIPAALSIGAGASLRVLDRPRVRLQLEFKNLLDDRSLQDGFANPLPGRMILLGMSVGAPQGDGP